MNGEPNTVSLTNLRSLRFLLFNSGSSWLRRELAPFPGREAMTLRLVVAVVLVTVVSMTLQIPFTAVSAYMVFFITKENRVITTITGITLALGATIGVALSLFAYRYTFDRPEFRIPVMALTIFGGMFLSRILSIGPLAFAIGFVIAITQSAAELVPDTDSLVRALLWIWVAIVFPAAIAVVVNQTLLPADPEKSSSCANPQSTLNSQPSTAKPRRSLFVPDAFTNPAHVQFGLKVSIAAMTCYVIYTGLDW